MVSVLVNKMVKWVEEYWEQFITIVCIIGFFVVMGVFYWL
jgi:hypothetical protein